MKSRPLKKQSASSHLVGLYRETFSRLSELTLRDNVQVHALTLHLKHQQLPS